MHVYMCVVHMKAQGGHVVSPLITLHFTYWSRVSHSNPSTPFCVVWLVISHWLSLSSMQWDCRHAAIHSKHLQVFWVSKIKSLHLYASRAISLSLTVKFTFVWQCFYKFNEFIVPKWKILFIVLSDTGQQESGWNHHTPAPQDGWPGSRIVVLLLQGWAMKHHPQDSIHLCGVYWRKGAREEA